MATVRCEKNPIIKPEDVKPTVSGFEVIGAFNAGVTRLGDQVILLVRVAERPKPLPVVKTRRTFL